MDNGQECVLGELRMLWQGYRLGRNIESGKEEGVYVQGRQVPITKRISVSL